MKSYSKFKLIPNYEIVSELPDIDLDHLNRFIFLNSNDLFYVSSYSGWKQLGIEFPIHKQHLNLNILNHSDSINAYVINCLFDEIYLTNIQLFVNDISIFLKEYKSGIKLNNSTISFLKLNSFGFNSVTSKSLPIYILSINLEKNTNTDAILTDIKLFDASIIKLSNITGLLIGSPNFTVLDSLLLDSSFLSYFSSAILSHSFFGALSTTQFVIDEISQQLADMTFLTLTGTPDKYRHVEFYNHNLYPYLRGNGIDWTTFSFISADEIYSPLTICSDACLCKNDEFTTSLQQTIYQLYKNIKTCNQFINFEYLIHNNDDLELCKNISNSIVIDSTNYTNSEINSLNFQDVISNWETFAADGQPSNVWQFDSTNYTIYSYANQSYPTYFISPKKYESYSMAITVRSNDPDDPAQYFCLVISHTVIDGIPYNLCLIRQKGLSWSAHPRYVAFGPTIPNATLPTCFLYYNFGLPGATLIAELPNIEIPELPPTGVWNGAFSRLFVCRNKNELVLACSPFNTETINPSTRLQINLNSYKLLNKFCGPQHLGFGAFTQEHLEFSNPYLYVPAITDPDSKIIYDVRTDDVWIYNCGSWTIDNCKYICDLETNKIYFNIITRKLFYLSCDYSVRCIMNLLSRHNQCICNP